MLLRQTVTPSLICYFTKEKITLFHVKTDNTETEASI
jgi:hypothetical protein